MEIRTNLKYPMCVAPDYFNMPHFNISKDRCRDLLVARLQVITFKEWQNIHGAFFDCVSLYIDGEEWKIDSDFCYILRKIEESNQKVCREFMHDLESGEIKIGVSLRRWRDGKKTAVCKFWIPKK